MHKINQFKKSMLFLTGLLLFASYFLGFYKAVLTNLQRYFFKAQHIEKAIHNRHVQPFASLRKVIYNT